MNKIIKLIIFISFLSLILCNINCDREKCYGEKHYFYANKKIMDYVEMYKPGNWWVYENNNKLLKDSIYIIKYSNSFSTYGSACDYGQYLTVSFQTKYLISEINKINLAIIYAGDLSFFQFFDGNTDLGIGYQMAYYQLTDSFEIINNSPQFKDSIKINNNFFYNIVIIRNIDEERSKCFCVFSKKIGLIQWFNGKDTFSLTNYYIQ